MKVFTHTKSPEGLPDSLETIKLEGKRHYITPEGNVYPSMTTVLSRYKEDSESLQKWRERVGEDQAKFITNRACDYGTEFHTMIEDYLNNKPVQTSVPIAKIMFAAAQNNLDRIDNIMAQEVQLYSDAMKIAGRTDCIAEYDGVLSLIDFKSARKEKDEKTIESYFVQCACYSLMFEERTGVKLKDIVVLMSTYDGYSNVFKKKRKDYYPQLKEVLHHYYEI